MCDTDLKYSLVETSRIPYLHSSFSSKKPHIYWLFCENPTTERTASRLSPWRCHATQGSEHWPCCEKEGKYWEWCISPPPCKALLHKRPDNGSRGYRVRSRTQVHNWFIIYSWMCRMTYAWVVTWLTYYEYVTSYTRIRMRVWCLLWRYVIREVGGWGRVPFSKKIMSPTPRRKWYSTTGRRAH